jgi:ABC-type glutathione transport system ATPase component
MMEDTTNLQEKMMTDPSSSTQDPVLRVRDLTVVYRRGAAPAVDRVSIDVPAHSIVGVVGESGSGKTSVAMVAAGLARATSGEVWSGSTRITTSMSRAERAHVQMVFQDPQGSLDPRQSVGSGLRELRRLHPGRTGWTTDEELLERVGLSPALLTRLPHQLSGGQAQRVSIGRALLLRPSVLIADEPTSALDVSVQAQILVLLDNIRRDAGLGILFISHDLAVVRSICETVHVMKSGRVVESGPTKDVMDRPRNEYTAALLSAIPGRELRHAQAAS